MSIRREIRLRKEFLHRKQTDINEMIKLDKKRKIKSAIDQGKAIPTELRNDARECPEAIRYVDSMYGLTCGRASGWLEPRKLPASNSQI